VGGVLTTTKLKSSTDTYEIAAVAEADFANDPEKDYYQVTISGPLSDTVNTPIVVSGLTLTAGEAGPIIKTQPAALTAVKVGDSAKLSIEMVNPAEASLEYAWYKAGSKTVLSTSGTLTIAKTVSGDTGYYFAVVTAASGWVQSVPSVVFVNEVDPTGTSSDATKIASTTAFQSLLANEGDTVTLRTFAIGDGLTYKWRRLDGVSLTSDRIKGVESPNLVLRGVVPSDGSGKDGVSYVASVYSGSTFLLDLAPWVLKVMPVPVILTQPESQTLMPGQTAIFSGSLLVTSDTRFQWYFRSTPTAAWVPVPGATGGSSGGSTCYVANVKEADAGEYRLDVSNTAGTVSSQNATLVVRKPVVVTGVSIDQPSVDPGADVTLTVNFTGDAQDNPYQWWKQNAAGKWTQVINGGSSQTLVLKGVSETDDAFYKARVFGKVNAGGVDSLPVRVSVHDAVALVAGQRLQTTSVVAGESTEFSVKATGWDPHYEWLFRKDTTSVWTPESSGTSATLSLKSITSAKDGYYAVRVTNAFSQAGIGKASLSAGTAATITPFVVGRLIVHTPPRLVSDLPTISGDASMNDSGLVRVNQGKSFTLTATLSDSTYPVVYKWRKDGVVIASASDVITAAPGIITLPFTSASKLDNGRYDLVLSNVYGVSVSAPVTVVVNLKPKIISQPMNVTVAEGSAASFRVDAEGEGISYEWFSGVMSNGTFSAGPSAGTGKLLSLSKLVAGASGTYYVARATNVVDSVDSTPARLTVTSAGDLKITTQPTFASYALFGGSVNLSVVAEGPGTLSYQWRKDGVPIAGGTSSVLALTNSADNNTPGVYDVFISNDANFVYSTPLNITVNPYLESVSIPDSANPGDGVRMEVVATSLTDAAPTYQWYRNTVSSGTGTALVDSTGVLSGGTSSVLVLKSVQLTDEGWYRVVVSVKNPSDASKKVSNSSDWKKMSVVSKVVITQQPQGFTKLQGDTAQLSVVASGGGTLKYRWLLDGGTAFYGATVSGGSSATLTLGSLALTQAGNYQVEVSNSAGSVLSLPAAVQVTPKFAVTVQKPARVSLGAGASLVATVQGGTSVSYQWYKGSGSALRELKGETGAQLRLNPVLAADVGMYTVIVTDGLNRTAQDSRMLELSRVPELTVPIVSQTVALGGTVSFAVGVKYDKTLKYSWTRWTGVNAVSVGGNSARLVLKNLTTTDFSTYTVRASDPDDATLYVESSATLAKWISGSGVKTVTGLDTKGVLGAANFSKWWIFWVDAAIARDATAKHAYGYFILERTELKDSGGALIGVGAGRAAWVWKTGGSSTWTDAEQQVQDAGANSKAFFSDVAARGSASGTFVLGGNLETGTDAAWYGAPEAVDGSFDDADLSYDVNLSWDADHVTALQGSTDWTGVVNSLQNAAAAAAAEIPGE
jgi:hypothetical protein